MHFALMVPSKMSLMNFRVKQINITETTNFTDSNNFHANISNGIILLSALVLLQVVNIFRNSKTSKSGEWPPTRDRWSRLPVLAKLTVHIIITTVLLPSMAFLGSILVLYRGFVVLLLKLCYKDKFKGLLRGPDTLWTLPDRSPSVLNILVVVRHQSYASGQFSAHVIQKLKRIHSDPALWKLRCGLATCMGYSYLIMKDMAVPCVRELDSVFYANREILQASLSELASVNIARGNLWETFVGVEPIAWGKKTHCYPLILRFHHVLGDGLALLQLVQRCFSSESTVIKVDKAKKISIKDESDNDLMQTIVKITIRLMHSAMLFSKFPSILFRFLLKSTDDNYLHPGTRTKLSGEKLITWKVENGWKYVNKVKKIKRRMGDAEFFDIVASSISYALNKFYKHKKRNNFKRVNAAISAIPVACNFVSMNTNKCVLANRFAIGMLILPMNIRNTIPTRNCLARCTQTIANLFQLRRSYQFQLNYWLMNIVMGLIPGSVIRTLLNRSLTMSTLVISNLPGPRRVSLSDDGSGDSFVEDIVFWVPHRGLTGVSISIFSYDDRFQLGLSIDKVYGVTRREAEGILESIFEYIDQLDEEVTAVI